MKHLRGGKLPVLGNQIHGDDWGPSRRELSKVEIQSAARQVLEAVEKDVL